MPKTSPTYDEDDEQFMLAIDRSIGVTSPGMIARLVTPPFVPQPGTPCQRCGADRLAAEMASYGSFCEDCWSRKLPGIPRVGPGIRLIPGPSRQSYGGDAS